MKENLIPTKDLKNSVRFWGHVVHGVSEETKPAVKIYAQKMLGNFLQNMNRRKNI